MVTKVFLPWVLWLEVVYTDRKSKQVMAKMDLMKGVNEDSIQKSHRIKKRTDAKEKLKTFNEVMFDFYEW